jgi:hypothetical protein
MELCFDNIDLFDALTDDSYCISSKFWRRGHEVPYSN